MEIRLQSGETLTRIEGTDALDCAVTALQLAACTGRPHPFWRLEHGIETAGALAIELAPALADAYGVTAHELLGAWAMRYGHSLAQLTAERTRCRPPRHLTAAELVDGM